MDFFKNHSWRFFALVFLCFFALSLKTGEAQAASLLVSPSTGSFEVGSTFDVSVLLDTQGKEVNTIQVSLRYPPDKLQLVSPATTLSIITLWTSQPPFNNQIGEIDLQGGIPGGINVSSGLITKLTFRVKSTGTATIKFLDSSRVLLHDGKGTDALQQTQSAIFDLILPPPAGPDVVSDTHISQGTWYQNPNVHITWASEENIEKYSYILSDRPLDIPDDISEGLRNSISYSNLEDGIHYFHIKAFREGSWGGVTHFALNIDRNPPAEFPIEIIPDAKTTRRKPVIQFATTDNLSTIDHYEIKIIPLFQTDTPEEKFLFIEAVSPYVPSEDLEFGSYDVIVRAYDRAGNHREVTQRMRVVTTVFQFLGEEGVQIKSNIIVPWPLFWILLIILLISLVVIAWKVKRWHHIVHTHRTEGRLPNHVTKKLEDLTHYRQKYGHMIFLLAAIGLSLMFGSDVLAQQKELAPPYIDTVSKNLSNEEIFYVGGKTDTAGTDVVLYLQNLQSGETYSYSVSSDAKGEWFYRHNSFLLSGNYLLWAQSRVGEELSPPTAQYNLFVRPTAIQFGSSRISYEVLYLIIIVILAIILAALISYIVFHSHHARRKHSDFMREVKEAEESIRRGFAVLRRDIQSELALIHQVKMSRALSDEEKFRETQLLADLDMVERTVGKEIWELENVEQG